MKKTFFLLLILYGVCPAYSQNDCLDKVAKQAVEIDSLQRQVIRPLCDSISVLNDKILELQEQTKNIAISSNNESKTDSLQKQVELISTNLSKAKGSIQEKEKQLTEEKQKNAVWANAQDIYKNKSFDELIQSSTKLSAQRDLVLFSKDDNIKPILIDLETYFNAKELLAMKFDASQIKNAQTQLNQIKRQSELLDGLKKNLKNYQAFTDGLKESIKKIIELDKNQAVSGMSEDIQKSKLNEISQYIFDYDFNLIDYPYLSNIVLEIIKDKQSNPDADISDLLKNLNY